MTELLKVEGLSVRFSGLTALDNVSFTLEEGAVRAVIGPNGAGKSTLINQLCGELVSDEGTIRLAGTDVTQRPETDRIGMGLGRTFQIASLLQESTVRENVGLAVQAHVGHNMRLFDRRMARRDVWTEADAMIAESGLHGRGDTLVSDLSHGEKKQLELIMALAGNPRLLLLDEPMAGLGQFESQRMIEQLGALRGKFSMLLVEHDMDAVYALADRISVLVYGRVIMTGTAEEIRESAEVREAYLGAEEDV